jgi:AcrR family transcriptional regulator
MPTGTPRTTGGLDAADDRPRATRSAARTRQRLLEVARHRFAVDGYLETTIRAITEEAGVNVALVSRYFGSKEGLFEACLESAAEDIKAPRAALTDQAGVAHTIAAALAQVPGSSPDEPIGSLLPLLLRSSGDARAEELRIALLGRFSESMAQTAGWNADAPDDDLLMRAQLVLCAGMGLALVRSWTPAIEPLASTGHDALVGAIADLVAALLPEG